MTLEVKSPSNYTMVLHAGAAEGVLLGGAVGLGLWFASHHADPPRLGRSVGKAALVGAAAGMLIPLLGGRLLGGSLALLADGFQTRAYGSRRSVTCSVKTNSGCPVRPLGGFEGALFAACIVGAMLVAIGARG